MRTKFRPAPEDTGKFLLVHTTQTTVTTLNGKPGFDEHTRALKKLIAAEPHTVVYISPITDWTGGFQSKESFAAVAAAFGNTLFLSDKLELKGEEGGLLKEAPLDRLNVIPGPKLSDITRYAKDGVSRRMLTSFQGQSLLHWHVAQQFNPEIRNHQNIRGAFSEYDYNQVYIDYRPLGSYSRLSLEDLISGNYDPSLIKDRIVLIGQDTGLEREDYAFTPLSRTRDLMTSTELHANMIETLIRNSAPVKAPDWLNLVFSILISIFTVHVVLTLKPGKGMLILLGAAFGFAIFSYFCFWPLGIWIDMAHPFLAIFLCYYFFIPYRLIMENRKSWEYFQKHKLLSEVEQLKTNFIGMMSHDLKTPLARIQGMTEVITLDPSPLSSNQREALDMIKQSSEDLLKFISTILNYAKIESQGIELHLQSKDINQILKDVARKHEFLARVKHIQLITELEPLFSIQVDPELIKQVFSNLVENAIKYSPENSKVLITSDESDGRIIVQVSDQGIGIPADELPNIFMKFFRSKNAKASPIKGSGLGLYLAKYFVELHRGTIQAESTPGQGSTFTVELPIEP